MRQPGLNTFACLDRRRLGNDRATGRFLHNGKTPLQRGERAQRMQGLHDLLQAGIGALDAPLHGGRQAGMKMAVVERRRAQSRQRRVLQQRCCHGL